MPTRRFAIAALAGFGLLGLSRTSGEAAAEKIYRELEPSGVLGSRNNHAPAPAWLTLPPTPTLPQATRTGLVKVNDASIFFAQFGAGPPVLLLHGGLANSNYWGHQITHLAQNFSVIAMDTRGHGRSPLTFRSFSYSMFAQDVMGLLDFLDISKASIVGWSDGGITGLQLAVATPNRVSKLFAFGANSSLDGLKPDGGRSRVFAKFITRCKTEYAALSPHPEKWPQLTNGLRLMWQTEPNFTAGNLRTVRMPTAISDGEHDEIIKRSHTERLASAIPGARLVIQPAVSHFAMLQNPTQFNRALSDFLTA